VAAVDVNRMKRSDQVIAVCGAILFICLFLPFFKGSVHGGLGGSETIGKGFFGWAPLWLGFLVGGLAFFPSLGQAWPPQIPVTRTIAIAGLSALATLILLLRFLKKPGVDNALGIKFDVTREFGLYLALLALIVQVVFAVMAFRESGEAMPDFKNLGGGAGTPPADYPPPPST